MAGRTSYLRAHITNECVIASSEVRATVFKQSSKIEKPAALAEDMTAVSNRRFEMKPSGKEMKKQKMNSASSSIMNFMEQKVDTNTSEALHILLLQAIIWGNISWNFLNDPLLHTFSCTTSSFLQASIGRCFCKSNIQLSINSSYCAKHGIY